MKKFKFLFFLCFCWISLLSAQNKFIIQNKKQSDKINFKLVNNLMVIPVEINGVELSFILDTGVSKPIIFNFLNVSDTLRIKDTETLFIRGLGDGEPLEALRSRNNVFRIGDAIKLKQDLYAIYGLDLNFTQRLGIPIHGIIGLDLFRDFIVEINYTSKYIKLFEPHGYKYKNCKNCEAFRLEFHKDKPYLNAQVQLKEKEIPIKLLIDTGGSDSLWLFENDSIGINSGESYFNDFLGHGLSGSVFGKRGKVESFNLKSFELKNANVAYPDSSSITFAKKIKNRNGSIAGNILKRFNIIMDYPNALITFKRNSNFKELFSYNKSGIEIAHSGVRLVKEYQSSRFKKNSYDENRTNTDNTQFVFNQSYTMKLKPAYAIIELREGSPAYSAGLKKGDIILTINGKSTHQLNLQQITAVFYGNEGKFIKLKVERDNSVLTYTFKLKSLL